MRHGMQRRDFMHGLGLGSLVLGTATSLARPAHARTRHRWKMVTTWPRNFPGLGTGASRLGSLIGEMSGGRIEVKVFGAGELVPTFGVFDAVSSGAAEMGHGTAFYWSEKGPAVPFFSSVPFGMTAPEVNAWLYHGGGLELWSELYGRFGVVPAPAGNSGVQMGGWFNKEIESLSDLQGLRMRIPGLGGAVLARAGGKPVDLPGEGLVRALQEGKIDATEWVGPYNDLAFELYKVAKYYYYPSWQEPATVMEAIINRSALESLPADLQSIVMGACRIVNQDMLAELTARNPAALQTLISRYGVELRCFPDTLVAELRALTAEVLGEIARADELAGRVYASYRKFQTQSKEWSQVVSRSHRLSVGMG